ncbi:MAG: hypothetical protein IJT77_06815 [Clostridia bacterium]|nr:hypothetical protein [Clostridia bacterium]
MLHGVAAGYASRRQGQVQAANDLNCWNAGVNPANEMAGLLNDTAFTICGLSNMKKISIRRFLKKPLNGRHLPKMHAPKIMRRLKRKKKEQLSDRVLNDIKIRIVSFNKETDREMLEFLADKPFQEYVKSLIERDMRLSSEKESIS